MENGDPPTRRETRRWAGHEETTENPGMGEEHPSQS